MISSCTEHGTRGRLKRTSRRLVATAARLPAAWHSGQLAASAGQPASRDHFVHRRGRCSGRPCGSHTWRSRRPHSAGTSDSRCWRIMALCAGWVYVSRCRFRIAPSMIAAAHSSTSCAPGSVRESALPAVSPKSVPITPGDASAKTMSGYSAACSAANEPVIPFKKCLDAEYAERMVEMCGMRPSIDETFTNVPVRRALKCGSTACMQ
mmetsp:Transcript_14007/g.43777  ORF Transcript_14007/g.43777 Transcript_14007/m.43777 type:complete len:208 (+) Transcript_14007:466-1089(+)